ncbi:Predicted protein tyrosine phosphatase [Granulicella rosea]|uniref:Phosphotyrosine protein phosphatase I domain-containing protein n=2 Tax=Granulicella rosea TaxID=474952 RepID=A0A239ICN4_9BACT|nr:Predicted protein tyrosine phosphatase [Granulicella rosea]
MAGFEVASAGTAPDAECVVDADLVEWADTIFCMENRQKKLLQTRFPHALQAKRLVVLGIPDRYGFMQQELVELLRARVLPLLR